MPKSQNKKSTSEQWTAICVAKADYKQVRTQKADKNDFHPNQLII